MTADLRRIILDLAAERGPEGSLDPAEIARAYAAMRAKPKDPPDAWRRYVRPVREEAIGLARQGKLTILRKGAPVDPKAPIKGLIRLRIVADAAGDGADG